MRTPAAGALACLLAAACGVDPAPPMTYAGLTRTPDGLFLRAAVCTGPPNVVTVTRYDPAATPAHTVVWSVERQVPDPGDEPVVVELTLGRAPSGFRELVPLAGPLTGTLSVDLGRGAPFFDTARVEPGRVLAGDRLLAEAAFVAELRSFCDEVL